MASRGDRWDTWDSRALSVERTCLSLSLVLETLGTVGGIAGASALSVSECPRGTGQISRGIPRQRSQRPGRTVPTVPPTPGGLSFISDGFDCLFLATAKNRRGCQRAPRAQRPCRRCCAGMYRGAMGPTAWQSALAVAMATPAGRRRTPARPARLARPWPALRRYQRQLGPRVQSPGLRLNLAPLALPGLLSSTLVRFVGSVAARPFHPLTRGRQRLLVLPVHRPARTRIRRAHEPTLQAFLRSGSACRSRCRALRTQIRQLALPSPFASVSAVFEPCGPEPLDASVEDLVNREPRAPHSREMWNSEVDRDSHDNPLFTLPRFRSCVISAT